MKPGRIADVILAGAGLGLVALAGYLVYRHHAHFFSSDNLAGRLTVFGLSLLGGVGLLGSLWLKAPSRVNLCLVLVSAGLTVYLAEGYLTMTHPVLDVRDYCISRGAQRNGVDFDARTKLEFITDLRSQGRMIYPAVVPIEMIEADAKGRTRSLVSLDGEEVFPLAGISRVETVMDNENGFFAVYLSDEHGFNNPRGAWASAQQAGLQVAVLGDSFPHGYCVRNEDNFVTLIGRRTPRILNLGFGGDGPLAMLATAKEFLPQLRPEKVLWCYFEGNDLSDLGRERRLPLLMRYLERGFSQGLAQRQAAIDDFLKAYVEMELAKTRQESGSALRAAWEYATLRQLERRLNLHLGRNQRTYGSELLELLERILVETKWFVGQWGGRVYFVYLPDWRRYGGGQTEGETNRNRVLDLVRRVGLDLIDLHPAFVDLGDPLSLFPFGCSAHYSPAGNRVVAEEVVKALSGR